jgi:hypothetical protein
LGLAIALAFSVVSDAKSPLQWVSFRSKEADPKGEYRLTDAHGPWLVFAASFAGEGAENEARQLVEELRTRYRMPAYVFSQQYDFTKPVDGMSVDPSKPRQKMKYRNASSFEEYAVLVGNFGSIDDPDLQKTMTQVKYAQPQCLVKNAETTTRRFAGLRELHKKINGDTEKKRKGPMGSAFATPNPLLPDEFFAPKGVDSFIIQLNQRVEKYSLLDCPKPYTVRVATFRGNVVIDPDKVAQIEAGASMQSQLEKAAKKAHDLTLALRKKGVEAYEFHDRNESYVTVGSFEWVTKENGQGPPQLNPEIAAVVQRYHAKPKEFTGKGGSRTSGMQPELVNNIPLDPTPIPIEVPRRSIATDYDMARRP